jgi:hypothetical protein
MGLEVFFEFESSVLVWQSDVAGQFPWPVLGGVLRLGGIVIRETLFQIGGRADVSCSGEVELLRM